MRTKTFLAAILLAAFFPLSTHSVQVITPDIVKLKAEATRGKYGLVVVHNKDGSFNREYKITAKELQDLQSSGRGIPTGLSKEEWESGLARVMGKDYDIGDVEELDGQLIIKYAERQEGGRFIESYVIFKPGEWSGKIPNVTVNPAVLKTLEGEPITTLVSGALEIKQ